MNPFNFAIATLCGYLTAVSAQTQEDRAKYAEFADEMALNGDYNWEPFEVVTEDGYILTVFHILGENSKTSFLHQTGYSYDWHSWLSEER